VGACTGDVPPVDPPPGDPTPPAGTVTLTAAPQSVAPGGVATLTWSAPADAICHASSLDDAFNGLIVPAGTTATSVLTVSRTYTLTCRRGLDAAVMASTTVAVVDDSPGCDVTKSCGPPPLIIPFAGAWMLESNYCEFSEAGAFLCVRYRSGNYDIYQGVFLDSNHVAGRTCREGVPGAEFTASVDWLDGGPNRVRVDVTDSMVLDGLAHAEDWPDAPRCQ
jgi:hypothetical protein